jgi:putative transposase
MVEVLKHYEQEGRYEMDAYVVMPDHLHLLLSPVDGITIERTVQYVKGGFSFRLRLVEKWNGPVWQESFTQHRVRDLHDYESHLTYIHANPVRARLVENIQEYPYSSAFSGAKAPKL